MSNRILHEYEVIQVFSRSHEIDPAIPAIILCVVAVAVARLRKRRV